MNRSIFSTQPLLGRDSKLFRLVKAYSRDDLATLLDITSDKISDWESTKQRNLKIPSNGQDKLIQLMLDNQYVPNRYLEDFFDSLVESYKITSIDDWEHFQAVYVDPSEFDDIDKHRTTFFSDLCKPEPSVLIGQRGTGKSTLFAGLTAYVYYCNTKKNNNNKSLISYIDARAFDAALKNMTRKVEGDDEEINDGDLSQIVLHVLTTAILKDVPKRYHAVRKDLLGVAAGNLDSDIGDAEALWDDIQEAIGFNK